MKLITDDKKSYNNSLKICTKNKGNARRNITNKSRTQWSILVKSVLIALLIAGGTNEASALKKGDLYVKVGEVFRPGDHISMEYQYPDGVIVFDTVGVATSSEVADVNKALADKADKSALDAKANTADVNKALADKADKFSLATKADVATVTKLTNYVNTNTMNIDTNIDNINKLDKRLGTIGNDHHNYISPDRDFASNLSVLDTQVGHNTSDISRLFSDYGSLRTDINKVGARSATLAGLHAVDYDPAAKLNFSVASGTFRSQNSIALGAFYRPNENVMFSAATTMGDSDNAYTFGVSFKIGPASVKSKSANPDIAELYNMISKLQNQMVVQQKTIAAQQKEIDELKVAKK